jgi:hypothetical protein
MSAPGLGCAETSHPAPAGSKPRPQYPDSRHDSDISEDLRFVPLNETALAVACGSGVSVDASGERS